MLNELLFLICLVFYSHPAYVYTYAAYVLCVYALFVFLALYKHYDGLIWPEILDDKAASEYWIVTKAKSLWRSKPSVSTSSDETSSRGGNIKFFGYQDHLEFRKYALNFYLGGLVNHFIEITERDPFEIIKMVYAVYSSMSCSYLYYDKNEQKWMFEEITEVCTYVSIINIFIIIIVEYLICMYVVEIHMYDTSHLNGSCNCTNNVMVPRLY